MSIIKLDAIDSTNEFLKSALRIQTLDNFTVVVANEQTNGKGQMGSTWSSEPGKNLIMSILINDSSLDISDLFKLNVTVALSIIEVLRMLEIVDLSIKWPNDIMAGNKKIAGILIENLFKPDTKIVSIVGIGLNVNQTKFENLPQASSLALHSNRTFNLDELLLSLIDVIKKNVNQLTSKSKEEIWDEYHQNLFKFNVPVAFEDKQNNRFMGMINCVDFSGNLVVETEDGTKNVYELKEIKMLF